MKKIAIWNNYTCFAQNKLFDKNAYLIGEDLWAPYFLLKAKLEERNYILETFDMDTPDAYDHIIFSDYPNPKTCPHDIYKIPRRKLHLVISECEMIYKPNANTKLFDIFHTVFTYNDELVKNHGYIKLHSPNRFKAPIQKPFHERKFCTMMAGNKFSNEHGELYSERRKIIACFSKNFPELFDLYGFDWDKKIFHGPRLIRGLNRIKPLQKILAPRYPVHRGRLNSKLQTLSQYKYAICYENTSAIKGYISEKIFDCFFAGTIPVYLGCENITDHIPENCFIDRRKFQTNELLIKYLQQLTEYEYNQYLIAITNFLQSDKGYVFSDQCFADVLINTIL
ncbi:hypothetical protein FACS1894151_11570 [Spirochaetia bacterium]|nr:hypothetical protein FACS1894151_11570 [Spirochaetia bacterium]